MKENISLLLAQEARIEKYAKELDLSPSLLNWATQGTKGRSDYNQGHKNFNSQRMSFQNSRTGGFNGNFIKTNERFQVLGLMSN